jgi:uncharacterized protein
MKSLLASLLLFAFVLSHAAAQGIASPDNRPKISVNGEAVVNVVPDRIVINLGIETWDADIVAAKKHNNDILAAALGVVRERGVRDKDIQTDHLSIEPRWENEYRKTALIGYIVRNAIVVTLSETGKVEDLITGVLNAGVTHIHGIDFQTTELKKHREQARELALRAAKEKAEKMAEALDQHIGRPLQISEDYSGSPWWYGSSWWGYGRAQAMAQTNVQAESGPPAGDISGSIALGKISVRANVSVVFELK